MPSPYRVKTYIKGAYYHIVNRGVNGQNIFLQDTDYERFINKMTICLTERKGSIKNHKKNVNLVAFCLMPNHFHLLVQNKTYRGIEKFMRSICISHARHINKNPNRVGHLFQDTYKAVMVKTDEHLLAASRYIHINPEYEPRPKFDYPYSSLKYYLSMEGSYWLKTNPILDYFSSDRAKANIKYKDFLERAPKFVLSYLELWKKLE